MTPTIRVIEFKTEYTRDGRPVDWVLVAPIHAIHTSQTWHRIRDIIPPENEVANDRHGLKMTHIKAIWSMIEPAYTAWKSGQEVPETGTPLGAWPGLNAAQADVLKRSGIRTVEEVANITDGQAEKIKLPDMRGLRRQAQAFLDAREGAETAHRLTDLEAQNKALQERLEQLLGSQQPAPEPSRERHYNAEELRAECDRLGIKYDKRWGAEKLLEALEQGKDEEAA